MKKHLKHLIGYPAGFIVAIVACLIPFMDTIGWGIAIIIAWLCVTVIFELKQHKAKSWHDVKWILTDKDTIIDIVIGNASFWLSFIPIFFGEYQGNVLR